MKKDKMSYRRLKVTKTVNLSFSSIIELPECPRLNYSVDMPLKKPTIRCCFRRKYKRECIFHPSLCKMLEDKNIKYEFGSRFKCVVNNKYMKKKNG